MEVLLLGDGVVSEAVAAAAPTQLVVADSATIFLGGLPTRLSVQNAVTRSRLSGLGATNFSTCANERETHPGANWTTSHTSALVRWWP